MRLRAGPLATRPPSPGTNSEPWQKQSNALLAGSQPFTVQPWWVQIAERATTLSAAWGLVSSSMSASGTRTRTILAKRDSVRCTPDGSTAVARTGSGP